MKRILATAIPAVVFLWGVALHAQTIAVYPVKTEGFSLNGSEVTEVSRIALQACYDEGLFCLARGQTLENIQKEQTIAGGGQVQSAPYIAEFALVGKTEDKVDVGVEGMRILGGAAKNIGGVYVGAGADMALKGMKVSGSSMELIGQVFRTADGAMIYSEANKKLGMRGEFIIVAGRSANSDKLLAAFRKMFRSVKKRLGAAQ